MVQTLWDSITQSITGAPSADDIRRRREDESAFSSLYDAARQRDAELAAAGRRPVLGGLLSKEPVAGMDTLRYEGITPLILGLLSPVARAVDAPMAAYQGNIPMQDMAGEALGTAGMAALGGAALTRPAGSVGMGGRVVYRGETGSAERIKGGISEGNLFVTPNIDVAKLYGDNITEYTIPDSARVLVEGTKEFADVTGRRRGQLLRTMRQGENLVQAATDAVSAAKAAGYDAVEFNSTRDLGISIINPDIFSANRDQTVGPQSRLPAPRNEAEAMARNILEMRAAGRAGDVTEEMRAAADPMYMYQNTPLPMDEASRMARAREMGLEEQYYKGMYPYDSNTGEVKDWRGNVIERAGELPVEIQTIDNPNLFPTFNRADRAEPGYKIAGVMARDVDVANRFASWPDAAVYPLQTRAGRVYDVDAAGGSAASTHFFEEGRPFRDAMRSGQYDTGVIRNTADEGDIAFALDPRNIRSRFALFDPEFRHLRNLSAGVGGLGLLATQMPEQQRDEEIRQYLGGLL